MNDEAKRAYNDHIARVSVPLAEPVAHAATPLDPTLPGLPGRSPNTSVAGNRADAARHAGKATLPNRPTPNR